MAWIAGVDGCRGGWIASWCETERGIVECRMRARFDDVMQAHPDAAVIAMDMPIGLVAAGERACDAAARRVLGRRACTIFSTPVLAAVQAETYALANKLHRHATGKGLTYQAYALAPKIRQVRTAALASPRSRIRECHPELAFAAMQGGAPVAVSKTTHAGLFARRKLLERALGEAFDDAEQQAAGLRGFATDDPYDALALAWTAGRILRGEAGVLAGEPSLDGAALPLEICY